MTTREKTDAILARDKSRSEYYGHAIKMFAIAEERHLRLVMENPWNENTSAGKDAMSMAYATMEDGIGEAMLDNLRDKIDAYGRTPEGRKYFYGDHVK